MTDALRKFINAYTVLDTEDFDTILEKLTIKELRKKEHLVSAGETCNEIAFFEKGYFRFYHYSPAGVEITTDFRFAPHFITSYTSLITRKPSQVYVQAMESMVVWIIRYSDLMNLYNNHPRIERFGRIMAEQVAIESEKHLFSLLNFNAEERYNHLLKEYPDYIQNIPLQYLASFLGIKQETLSRVRQKQSKP